MGKGDLPRVLESHFGEQILNINKIKERINKLLNTAANEGSTPNEKAVAMQMATDMMRQYNLDRDDISEDHINATASFKTVTIQSLWSRMTPWESQLAVFVTMYIVKGVYCVESKIGNTGRNRGAVGRGILNYTGAGEDAEIAAATFTFLRDLLVAQCTAKYGSPVRDDGRMYSLGFVRGLFLTAKEAVELENDAAATSRALIRTDMLQIASRDYYLSQQDSDVKVTSKSAKIYGRQGEAYNLGVTDGRAANAGRRHPIAARIG